MIRGDNTKQTILDHSVKLLAEGGPEYVGLRRVGTATGIVQSAIYYHYKDKSALLSSTFFYVAASLGRHLAELPPTVSVRAMLEQRIEYQFDNAELIVAMLKYFMANRSSFSPRPDITGFVPPQAYRHFVEVIQRGNYEGKWSIADPDANAKVMVHAVNGFVLEYFPDLPEATDRAMLVQSIADFTWWSLTNSDRA